MAIFDTDSEASEDLHFDMGSQTRKSLHSPPDRWKDLPVTSCKFIDDLNAREKSDITDCEATISTQKEIRHLHARKLEDFYNLVRDNADALGMRVNPSKTQLLCTTTAINYEICLLYTSPSPRDRQKSRMPSSA